MKDERLYLIHIRECLERIREYVRPGREAFYTDSQIQDAVVRNFEVIGEAAKRVSSETRAESDAIHWKRIAGFRDILIHRYEDVDLDEVWHTVESEVENLYVQICALLKKSD